jgi:basic amino acid/polyamine antiporter, APA family
VPVAPLIGAALCIFLMTYLDAATWIRFGVWLVIGLAIYALYGYRNSMLRAAASPGGPASLR